MKNGFTRLLSQVGKYKRLVVISAICNILLSIFTLVSIPLIIPFFQILFGRESNASVVPSGWDITQYLNYYFGLLISSVGKEIALLWVCLAIVVVFFLKNLFRYLALYFMAPVRNGVVRDIRQKLFEKYLSLPLSFFTEEKKGDLLARITVDVQEIEWSILNTIEVIFKTPLIIIGSIFIMINISPSLTRFVFLLLIFTIVVIGFIGKSLKRKSSKAQKSLGVLNSITEESLGGIKIIKGFGAENHQNKAFLAENNSYMRIVTSLLRRRDMSSPISEFLGVSVVAILLWYGSIQVLSQALAPEIFFAFIFAFYQVIEPSKSFSTAYYNIQKGLAALDRVEEITSKEEVNAGYSTVVKNSFDSSIRFENMNFTFPGTEKPVLNEINLEIVKGEKVAIVGSSGSGKTTLVDMILGYYSPNSGSVKIDGSATSDLDKDSRKKIFGLVTQAPILFNGTVEDNIRFGRMGSSHDQVTKVSKIANAHEFIEKLPRAYNTNIGDSGVKLSGGQRQRLTIARAILGNPDILILDEATSALDSESEELVQNALEEVMKNRTAIIIAHRLSTIQHVDRIVVLSDGRIVQQGTHNDLIKLNGNYKKFVEMQTFAS